MKKKMMQIGLMLGLVTAMFVIPAMAQRQIPLFIAVKTGTASGAGTSGSNIKVTITYVDDGGRQKVAGMWLTNADLSNGAYSRIKSVVPYYGGALPVIKNVRVENHGSNSVFTGDNWYCEYVCFQLDYQNRCETVYDFNRWLNGGESMTLD